MEIGRLEAVKSNRFKRTFVKVDRNEENYFPYRSDLGVVCMVTLGRFFIIPRGTKKITLVGHTHPGPHRIRVAKGKENNNKSETPDWIWVKLEGQEKSTEVYSAVTEALQEMAPDRDVVYVEVVLDD
jgi:hypothetical protein